MASFSMGISLIILPTWFITWIVLFLPIWIAIWAIVGYLVYLDAKNRGMNALEWGLSVFLFFVVGLIAYLLIRSEMSKGKPMPVLVVMLVGSFVLMLLSGAMFMLGLPEAQSRALFLATVVIWIALGIWAIVDGQLEMRRLAAAQAAAKDKAKAEAEAETGTKPGAEGPSAMPSPVPDDGAKAR